ncbi:RES family NAD+ phosphorylase [Nafulsella turpanensis]|uniref:RES family NAD+ phosphorylase n=1 Tax=Nafulsella turpanensis TaxID=1265690 RepID=UPI000346ACF5|nr:RES family NAD+ phosphorylase [Nafulsella turpanensis]
MELYRIVYEKFADRLFAPGFSGRWNEEGQFVVYTASNRSLASLENMVHKMGQGVLSASFVMMVLELPGKLPVTTITRAELPQDWKLESSHQLTQPMSPVWYEAGETLLLKVPSAVVPEEYNVVLNARHPDFSRVRIREREPFRYDHRFVALEKELIKESGRS